MVWVSAVPVLPLLGLSLLFEGPDRDAEALAALDWSGVGIILFVAWVSTVFGFGTLGFLLRQYPASSVAPFTLLVPVFGMSSAALVLGEDVSPLRWCAAALLVGGVALTSGVGLRAATPLRSGRTAAPLPEPDAGATAATAGAPVAVAGSATASGPRAATGGRVRRPAGPAAPPPPGASASRTPSTPRCPDPSRPGTPPAAAPRSPAAAE